MIDQDRISGEWIGQVSAKNRRADRILVEKAIRALLLLEGLAKKGLPFVFKGGTSLMLHLDSAKRLSIDIDIIMPGETADLGGVLDAVASEQGFLRKELQHRNTDSSIKKEHYKFFYIPLHKTRQDEEYVLLDILFEETYYSRVTHLPVRSVFVPATGEPLEVSVPCLEDILGDKLTAFAPNTTGIPYFKGRDGMGMEIIKQLYDIGSLLEVVEDAGVVKETFHRFAETELAYRGMDGLAPADVLEDIFQTSLCIVSRGADGNGNFEELRSGIRRITPFIFSESYHIEKAIVHASRAAYLSAMVRFDAPAIERFRDISQVGGQWVIGTPFNTKLNKLKKSSPEAFYYWYKVYEMSIR